MTTRDSSLFTFIAMWLYAEAENAEDAMRAHYIVFYGHNNWPSHSEWMIPR